MFVSNNTFGKSKSVYYHSERIPGLYSKVPRILKEPQTAVYNLDTTSMRALAIFSEHSGSIGRSSLSEERSLKYKKKKNLKLNFSERALATETFSGKDGPQIPHTSRVLIN